MAPAIAVVGRVALVILVAAAAVIIHLTSAAALSNHCRAI